MEVANRELKQILKKTIEHNRRDIAFKMSIGITLYRLVYEKACHLPVELEHKAYWPIKFLNFDLSRTGEKRSLQLNELEEWKIMAYENVMIYKERAKQYHDQHIK